ncbi:MAG: ComF family protein [Candidatus Saccharimonadales bacterium]
MFIIESLISVIAPHYCLVCGTAGSLVCVDCCQKAFGLVPARCYRCRSLSEGSKTCSKCRKVSPLGRVWVGAEYSGTAQELVGRLKFGRAGAAAAGVMAARLASVMPIIAPGTIIVAVPTASSRVRRRGYDQAELIARALAQATGAKYEKLLIRHGQSRQVGTRRAARLKQLETAFQVCQPNHAAAAKIVLVDDVLTTGASLQAVAQSLKSAGAKTIDAAVFAQA